MKREKINLNQLRVIVENLIKEEIEKFDGDKSALSGFLGKEIQIERDSNGLLSFTFDASGWYFETNDVFEGCAIVFGSKYKSNEGLRKLTLTQVDKDNVTPIDGLYWLSGSNTAWKFGEHDYTVSFDEIKQILIDEFNGSIESLVSESTNLGDIIDGIDDIKNNVIGYLVDNYSDKNYDTLEDLNGDYKSPSAKRFFENNVVDSIYNDTPLRIIEVDGKYNFIDEDNDLQSPEQWYDSIDEISNKKPIYRIQLGNKFLIGDVDCDILFADENPYLSFVGEFGDEQFCKIGRNGEYNYISLDGDLISNEWFLNASDFRNGTGTIEKSDGVYVIDVNGNLNKRK
jgi:hypothetical protein